MQSDWKTQHVKVYDSWIMDIKYGNRSRSNENDPGSNANGSGSNESGSNDIGSRSNDNRPESNDNGSRSNDKLSLIMEPDPTTDRGQNTCDAALICNFDICASDISHQTLPTQKSVPWNLLWWRVLSVRQSSSHCFPAKLLAGSGWQTKNEQLYTAYPVAQS